MISSKYLKCYSDLILEMLDRFDEEFSDALIISTD